MNQSEARSIEHLCWLTLSTPKIVHTHKRIILEETSIKLSWNWIQTFAMLKMFVIRSGFDCLIYVCRCENVNCCMNVCVCCSSPSSSSFRCIFKNGPFPTVYGVEHTKHTNIDTYIHTHNEYMPMVRIVVRRGWMDSTKSISMAKPFSVAVCSMFIFDVYLCAHWAIGRCTMRRI